MPATSFWLFSTTDSLVSEKNSIISEPAETYSSNRADKEPREIPLIGNNHLLITSVIINIWRKISMNVSTFILNYNERNTLLNIVWPNVVTWIKFEISVEFEIRKVLPACLNSTKLQDAVNMTTI